MRNKFSKLFTGTILVILIGLSSINFYGFVSAAEKSPAARYGHAMVFDSINSQTILFGGYNNDVQLTKLSTTWIYSSADLLWTEIDSEQVPETRFGHNMAFNTITGKIILFSGTSIETGSRVGDTWEFDTTTNEWTELSLSIAPQGRNGHSMYYDPIFNEIILYGGSEYNEVFGDTWIFNCSTNTWHQVFPSTTPGQRYGQSVIYDEENQVGVLYGGRYSNGPLMDETWIFNRTALNWVQKYPPIKPISRYFAGIAYNSYTSEILLFGGDDESYPLRATDDTWIFNTLSTQWSRLYPDTKPEPRSHNCMVFDSYLNRAILFGGVGEDYTKIFDDLWFYNFNINEWNKDILTNQASFSFWIIFIGISGIISLAYIIKRK